jgi:hypothetical protein
MFQLPVATSQLCYRSSSLFAVNYRLSLSAASLPLPASTTSSSHVPAPSLHVFAWFIDLPNCLPVKQLSLCAMRSRFNLFITPSVKSASSSHVPALPRLRVCTRFNFFPSLASYCRTQQSTSSPLPAIVPLSNYTNMHVIYRLTSSPCRHISNYTNHVCCFLG